MERSLNVSASPVPGENIATGPASTAHEGPAVSGTGAQPAGRATSSDEQQRLDDGVGGQPLTEGRHRSAQRSRGLGLRGRATLAFAVVAVVLSSTLGATVWATVSGYLLHRREQIALAQTAANVKQVRLNLASPGLSNPELLAQLPHETGSVSLLLSQGRWSTTSLDTDRGALPAELRGRVIAGESLQQRIATSEGPRLVIGLPLPRLGEAYFEVFPLTELDQTLRTLSTTLLLAVFLVPAGSLLLGHWALRPALRPLEEVSQAAAEIAAGNLGARLDPHQDVTLASIAASFNRTAAALERRVRADAKFAADVSHELRSPLTTMLSAVDLIEAHRAALPADGQESLDLLRAEVAQFERLVADLLEISRADAGSADVMLEAVVLPDLVERSVPDRLRGRVHVGPDARVVVRVDKRRLERVVMNLVNNAEEHAGGVTAVVVSRENDYARVAVEDGGPGIDPAERERIFERFARGRHSSRDSTDGAGLGLSLVARHVEVMGGRVSLEDVPGGGSRFIVSLPAAAQESECPG